MATTTTTTTTSTTTSTSTTTTITTTSTSTTSTTTLPPFEPCINRWGNTTSGSTVLNTANIIRGSFFLREDPCEVWCIKVLLNTNVPTKHRCAIYDLGYNLIGQTEERTINTGGYPVWETFCFNPYVWLPVVPEIYILAVWAENGGGTQYVYATAYPNGEVYRNAAYTGDYNDFDPLTPTGFEDYMLSIYACCGSCGGICDITTSTTTTTMSTTSTTTYTTTSTSTTTMTTTTSTSVTSTSTTITYTTPPPLERNKKLYIEGAEKNYYEYHYIKNHPNDDPDIFDTIIPYDASINFFDEFTIEKDGVEEFIGFIEKIEPTASSSGRQLLIAGRCWKVLPWKKWNERFQESRDIGPTAPDGISETGFFGKVYPDELAKFLLRCPISVHPQNTIRHKIGWGIPSDDWSCSSNYTYRGRHPSWAMLREIGFAWRGFPYGIRNGDWFQVDLGASYDKVTAIYVESRNSTSEIMFPRNYYVQVKTAGGPWETVVTVKGNCARDVIHSWEPEDNIRYIRILAYDNSGYLNPNFTPWDISQIYVFQGDEKAYRLLDSDVYDKLTGFSLDSAYRESVGNTTVGYTNTAAIGAYSIPNGNMAIVGPLYIPVSGQIENLKVYLGTPDGPTFVRGVLYKKESAGYPLGTSLRFIAQTPQVGINGTGWFTFTFSSPINVSQGDVYFFGVCAEAGKDLNFYRKAGGTYLGQNIAFWEMFAEENINCTPPANWWSSGRAQPSWDDHVTGYWWLIYSTLTNCTQKKTISPLNIPYGRVNESMGRLMQNILPNAPTNYQPYEWWIDYDGLFRMAERRGSDKSVGSGAPTEVSFVAGVALGKSTKSQAIYETAQRIRIVGRGEGKDQDDIISNWAVDTAAMATMNTFYERIISQSDISNKSDADIYANVLLEELAGIFDEIEVIIDNDPYAGGTWDIGDDVTITDAATGLAGSYRIHTIEQRVNRNGGETLILNVGKRYKDINDRLAEIERELRKLTLSGTALARWFARGGRQGKMDPQKMEEVWEITSSNKWLIEPPEDTNDPNWGWWILQGSGAYDASKDEFSVEVPATWNFVQPPLQIRNRIKLMLNDYDLFFQADKNPKFKCDFQIFTGLLGGKTFTDFGDGDFANIYISSFSRFRFVGFRVEYDSGYYLYAMLQDNVGGIPITTKIDITGEIAGGIQPNTKYGLEVRVNYDERVAKFYVDGNIVCIIPFSSQFTNTGLSPCYIGMVVDNSGTPIPANRHKCLILFHTWKTEAELH